MIKAYQIHVTERAAQNLPPLPLNAEQVASVVDLLKNPPAGEGELLLDLLENRTPAGVDQAAYVKAALYLAMTSIAASPRSALPTMPIKPV